MKVSIVDDGLMIEPETEFETQYISNMRKFPIKSFVKCGLTPKDVLGIKILSDKSICKED